MAKFAKVAPVGEYAPLHITANGTLVPVGVLVNTTASTAVAAPGSVVITPVSMVGISPFMQLTVYGGAGTAETVQVSATTLTTFTATFTNTHSGTYNLISFRPTSLGSIVVNAAGSGATLTLYNGNPNLVPVAGAAIAIITLNSTEELSYNCLCDKGLWYTLASTSAPDLTLMYLDHAV